MKRVLDQDKVLVEKCERVDKYVIKVGGGVHRPLR